ncbi:MAG: BON domain-containing protein [Gemmatimonadota bacterium]
MKFKRRKRTDTTRWLLAGSVAVAGAAAVYAVSRLLRTGPVSRRLELSGLEKRIVHALLEDDIARSQGIDIAAVGTGVVEVSGTVETREDARHVVDLIDVLPGVHTVLNRLEIRSIESQLDRNRVRAPSESPRWYGGNVGIGRRRQSYATDPVRRDDHTSILTRALQPNRDDVLTDVEETEGTGVRIGVSNANSLAPTVPPRSPDRASDQPGPPPPVETEPRLKGD